MTLIRFIICALGLVSMLGFAILALFALMAWLEDKLLKWIGQDKS